MIRRRAQTIAPRVSVQVEENVNFVGANQLRRVLVRQVKNISPAVGRRAQLLRDKIFFLPRRVKISFEKIFVEVSEQRTRLNNHGMGIKAGGKETHANFFVRIKFFRERFDVRQKFFVFVVKRAERFGRGVFAQILSENQRVEHLFGLRRAEDFCDHNPKIFRLIQQTQLGAGFPQVE